MGVECIIEGIAVKFPFDPYDIQKDYMSKVIECLQKECHGVLESPTGTGKTLSLLCASLAWLEAKKGEIRAKWQTMKIQNDEKSQITEIDQLNLLGSSCQPLMGMPQIIYSSRTHSQLSQAMQELKRTSYSHLKASVLGSRDQMCIHPEIVNEQNHAAKLNLCQLKVKTRTCHFFNGVERIKESPIVRDQNVVDIEDLVKLGEKHKFCPYYMSKEMKQRADIIFLPYNYLFDPKIQKALDVQLSNNIIILDEAHNVEKMCEESASLELKTADIALCIEEITTAMKALSTESQIEFTDSPPEFAAEELCILKQMFLDFEKALDSVEINNTEGKSFEGNFIFQLLNEAQIKEENFNAVISSLNKVSQFLQTANEGTFQRKGYGLSLFEDILRAVFNNIPYKERINKCYKVYIRQEEEIIQKEKSWLTKVTSKQAGRILNYWCFSPGFGMNMLLEKGVKTVILTSGTLAPLKPLISELEMNIGVQLENPHIVKDNQICVKILSKGPDGNALNCNYQNRNNPDYIKSLGMTISNLAKFIPDGLLVFFPSYPLLKKYRDVWQQEGLWSKICAEKNIFVEPQNKKDFQEAMMKYYQTINDPKQKGAIFMGVCRGKVSEGLDFANKNGRGVIIIGLPYPPLKDPRIILKKKYLDVCHANNKEYLCGNDWYSLEATKAVNQAIGRVIRHKNDFGAIILLDARFNNPRILNQMSLWLRQHVKNVNKFGEAIRELKTFFSEANQLFPTETLTANNFQAISTQFSSASPIYNKLSKFDFKTSSACSLDPSSSENIGLDIMYKRNGESLDNLPKRKKITIISKKSEVDTQEISMNDIREYLIMVKKCFPQGDYKKFVTAIKQYRDNYNLEALLEEINPIFYINPNARYTILGLHPYIKEEHKEQFNIFINEK